MNPRCKLAVLMVMNLAIALAQDITLVPATTSLIDTLGKEMVFSMSLKNISAAVQTVYVVRTLNDLPFSWNSSLCFGSNCYASFLDSVATTSDFGSSPVQPGEVRDISVHVYSMNNNGTGRVHIAAGTVRNPGIRIPIELNASTIVTAIEVEKRKIGVDCSLEQNFPNPFNPMTTIPYTVPQRSFVTVKVIDLLGRQVAVLVDEMKAAGRYSVQWDAYRCANGVYFSVMRTEKFRATKRMILMK